MLEKYLLKSGAIELESVIVELSTTSFEDELKPLGFRIISSLIPSLNKSFIKLPLIFLEVLISGVT